MKKILIGSAALVGAVGIGLGVAGNFFYKIAIANNKKEFLENDKNLPKPIEKNPFEAENNWYLKVAQKETWIQSEDGLKLFATFITAEDAASKKVAILAHGYTASHKQMGAFAKLYYDLGYHVLVPDARGHGRSEGDYIGFGWPERRDYVGWIHHMIQKIGEDCEMTLFGISMGGATVMMTSGEELPSNVKVIVEDCGYSSVYEELTYQLKEMYHLPGLPLMPVTSFITELRAGYGFKEASSVNQLKKNKVPMLFIHGGADTFVPTEMIYEVYAANPTPKQMHIFAGASHGASYAENKEEYRQLVTDFVTTYIK